MGSIDITMLESPDDVYLTLPYHPSWAALDSASQRHEDERRRREKELGDLLRDSEEYAEECEDLLPAATADLEFLKNYLHQEELDSKQAEVDRLASEHSEAFRGKQTELEQLKQEHEDALQAKQVELDCLANGHTQALHRKEVTELRTEIAELKAENARLKKHSVDDAHHIGDLLASKDLVYVHSKALQGKSTGRISQAPSELRKLHDQALDKQTVEAFGTDRLEEDLAHEQVALKPHDMTAADDERFGRSAQRIKELTDEISKLKVELEVFRELIDADPKLEKKLERYQDLIDENFKLKEQLKKVQEVSDKGWYLVCEAASASGTCSEVA